MKQFTTKNGAGIRYGGDLPSNGGGGGGDLESCLARITALEAERDRLREALTGIATIIRKNVTPAPEPHVLILEDGSRHTGPAVDYLHRLADAIARLCEHEAGQ